MIDLYYWTTPNGHKITIFLEEAALAYKIVPVNKAKAISSSLSSLRSPRIIEFRQLLITSLKTAASRSRCLNPALSCFIWQRRLENS